MPLLKAPPNGVTVRMYRLGHGDCFLLAMPRAGGADPYYVLIDCGYKPGSPAFLDAKPRIADVVAHLYESCGGRIDLAILTHEHQDHLNGIWKKNKPYFEDFQIDEAWVAWTENPTHDLANDLRKRHKDQLLGLLAARRELALAVGETDPAVRRVDQMLALELGGGSETMSMAELLAAAEDPAKSVNKQALKLVREKALAGRGYHCLAPGGKPRELEGSAGVRAFILGPPEHEGLIADEDPIGDEGFPRDNSFSFAEAARAGEGGRASPFTCQYSVSIAEALGREGSFFAKRYGRGDAGGDDQGRVEVPDGASWRRIDDEWLYSAETLAIKLNKGVNNTCLVVAFELSASKKVLLFAADAQRGNWISWKDVEFEDGTKVRDLMARTVLYKVGHHGSHNATLAGKASDDYVNLAWMGLGQYASEFTAMITAVSKWASENDPPWVHPLPSIKEALLRKAQGRVLQTDENEPERPSGVSDAEWKRFTDRIVPDELYFDLTIEDA